MGNTNSIVESAAIMSEIKEPVGNPTGWVYVSSGRLLPGRQYFFDGWGCGKFPLKGGAVGRFTVENNYYQGVVRITDQWGEVLWTHCENLRERITFMDNPKEGCTHVILSKDGVRAVPWIIPVTVHYPQEQIYLGGNRWWDVDGKACPIKVVGQGRVTVHTDAVSVDQEDGPCAVYVDGSVLENVAQDDKGLLEVKGNVLGNIVQLGTGRIEVVGYVRGEIEQHGDGTIVVKGGHLGRVTKTGKGQLDISGQAPQQTSL